MVVWRDVRRSRNIGPRPFLFILPVGRPNARPRQNRGNRRVVSLVKYVEHTTSLRSAEISAVSHLNVKARTNGFNADTQFINCTFYRVGAKRFTYILHRYGFEKVEKIPVRNRPGAV